MLCVLIEHWKHLNETLPLRLRRVEIATFYTWPGTSKWPNEKFTCPKKQKMLKEFGLYHYLH